MNKWFVIALSLSLSGMVSGCLDMSLKEPQVVKSLDCPDGFTPLSNKFLACPEDKNCETVVDPEDPNHTQLCVEYHIDTEGGGGINCPAGYVTVAYTKSSGSDTELGKCVFGDENPDSEVELSEDQYPCINGYKPGRFCRLVPEEDPSSKINVLMGQRCTEEQANPGTNTLRVHLMDIGQGDAIWIQTPGGKNVLIDGGDGSAYGKTSGGPIVTDYLGFHGFPAGSTFDAVFLTHPHSDHFGGFNNIFNNNYKLLNYIDPMDLNNPNPGGTVPSSYKTWIKRMQTIVTDKNNIYMPARSKFKKGEIMPEKFFGAGVTAQYITSRDNYKGDDANPASIVFKLTYAGRTFLFTGDAEAEQEAEAIAAVDDLSSHFLKVCHHGSSTSSTIPFLNAVWPASMERKQRYALISSGRLKYSGSYIPTQETVTRLLDYVPQENLFATSAGDDGKEEHDTYRDDNVLVVVKPDGSYYACYNGTN